MFDPRTHWRDDPKLRFRLLACKRKLGCQTWRALRLAAAYFSIGIAVVSCDRTDLTGGRPPPSTLEPLPVDACPDPPSVEQFSGTVVINELQVENVSTLEDETGAFPPWLELHNLTDEELDLSNAGLSNDLSEANKWRFPCEGEAILPAGGYLIVLLDGRGEELGGLHTNFSIDPADRPTLVLNGGSHLVFAEPSPGPDLSQGFSPDGQGNAFRTLETPTPAAANSDAAGPGPDEAEFIRGDANADQRVSIGDVVTLLEVLFGAEPGRACRDALDANDDGVLDMQDPTALQRALLYADEALPPPFPREGTDPTPDGLECIES